ncbi:MAG: hypothetical protein OEQ81_05455 [Flavobacteriaceae bacterium]|nr:hypothetical protein [Flavobacteriaceae bacterium]
MFIVLYINIEIGLKLKSVNKAQHPWLSAGGGQFTNLPTGRQVTNDKPVYRQVDSNLVLVI